MRAILYTRVSPSPKTRADLRSPTAAPRSLSLEAQLAHCRRHAEHKGYEVVAEFTDPAISGRDLLSRRPGLISTVELAKGQDDVVVIVYSLSRLSRRQSLTWALLDDRGEYRIKLESATEPFETSTPMGRAMLGMLAVWAQLEADMCSERTSDALAARKARGHRLGQVPMIDKRPEDVAKVKELYRTGGFGLRTLVRHLNAIGMPGPHGGKWHLTALARVIRSTPISAEASI